MPTRPTPKWLPYVAAILATALAAGLGGLLEQVVGSTILYVTFFAAVIFSAWYGGIGPGLLATAFTYVTANLYFISPKNAFVFNVATAAYLFVCVSIAALSEAMKRARRRAEASAEHVVSIVEKITDGFIAIDSNWRCAYLNRAAEEVNRLDRQEGIGKNPWELFPFTMGGVAAEKLRQAIGEQVTVEFEDFYEPWQCWFEVKASPADAGSLAIFFADVTERKLGQMALAQSEERFAWHSKGAGRDLGLGHAHGPNHLVRRVLCHQRIGPLRGPFVCESAGVGSPGRPAARRPRANQGCAGAQKHRYRVSNHRSPARHPLGRHRGDARYWTPAVSRFALRASCWISPSGRRPKNRCDFSPKRHRAIESD